MPELRSKKSHTSSCGVFEAAQGGMREKMSLLGVHGRKDGEPNDQNENPYAQQFPAAPAK